MGRWGCIGGEDAGQKTEPVEIKRDDEEREKCFNEFNEVIRSKDLILQDLGTVGDGVKGEEGRAPEPGAGGDADQTKITGQDVCHPQTF